MALETIREALHYAHQGGRLSRPMLGLDWVEEAARRCGPAAVCRAHADLCDCGRQLAQGACRGRAAVQVEGRLPSLLVHVRCRSQVTLLACGVQGSVSTLPDAAAAALCAAAAAAGDRVAGVVTKYTAVRALGGDGSEMSEMRLELEEAVLEVAFLYSY